MSNSDSNMFKSLALILISAGFLGFVAWKLPILEMMYLFVMIALIPATVLVALGIVTRETVNVLLGGPVAFRQRVDAYVEEHRRAQAAA